MHPLNMVSFLAAELWRCRPSLDERQRWRIAGAIHDQSRRYGYDPLFVLAMIKVESTCSPHARGSRGALGLIQVQPRTARAIAPEAGVLWSGPAMLTRSNLNLQLGLHYLWKLEKHFKDPWVAIVAYNMGPAGAAGVGRLAARQKPYVRKILAHYEDLLSRAGRSAETFG